MTICDITGWQCHCQPPEVPCDGLAELRKAYAEWRALAERRKQELSLAEEGLANYAQENERLKQRCWAMAFLLYPLEDGPREAVAGDLGLRSPQEAPT